MRKKLAVLIDFGKLVSKDETGRWLIKLRAIKGDSQCGDDSQWLSFCSEQFGLFFEADNVRLDALGLRVISLLEPSEFVRFVSCVSEFNCGLTQAQFEHINDFVFDETECRHLMANADSIFCSETKSPQTAPGSPDRSSCKQSYPSTPKTTKPDVKQSPVSVAEVFKEKDVIGYSIGKLDFSAVEDVDLSRGEQLDFSEVTREIEHPDGL